MPYPEFLNFAGWCESHRQIFCCQILIIASNVNSGSTSWTNTVDGAFPGKRLMLEERFRGSVVHFFEAATNSFVLQKELS
jgi:hypothetical protein